MNDLKGVLRRSLYVVPAVAAILLSVWSLFKSISSVDTDGIAGHVSHFVKKRMDKLDRFAADVLAEREGKWLELKHFPDDMVLYRYEYDTLNCWYNLFDIYNDDIKVKPLYPRLAPARFSLFSPLCNVSSEPQFINLRRSWYILKSYDRDNVHVIGGVLVKDMREEDLTNGRNGINRRIHIHGKYNIAPLGESNGSPVFLDGKPVFKIVADSGLASSDSILLPYTLRWIAAVLIVLSLVTFLVFHRTPKCCLAVVIALVSIAFLCRAMGNMLVEHIRFFSPMLYAHDGLLNSFGTLIVFNTAIFLCVFCIYLCRNSIAGVIRRRRIGVAAFSVLTLLLAAYLIYTLSSLVLNSNLIQDVSHSNSFGWMTVVLFVSYAFLSAAVWLCVDIALTVSDTGVRNVRTVMTVKWILLYSVAGALVWSLLSGTLGFKKEQSRVYGWSNRLAVNRNLGAELALRRVENSIEADPIIRTLAHVPGGEALLLRRLEDMYLGSLAQEFEIKAEVIREMTPAKQEYLTSIVAGAAPIGPGSRFLYKYSLSGGPCYTGVFSYFDTRDGIANLVLEIRNNLESSAYRSPENRKQDNSVKLPPIYSYAKYVDNRLVSFKGAYVYPLVVTDMVKGEDVVRRTFTSGGYRHFQNRINEEETIIISRREKSLMMYFVSFIFSTMLLFFTTLLLRGRRVRQAYSRGYFSIRMRRLVVVSLSVTLVIMAAVSVLFVYQRNDRNRFNIMSSKITSVQQMLAASCRDMNDCQQMQNGSFASDLENTGKMTNSEISLFTPDGKLFMASSQNIFLRGSYSCRINPEAYRNILNGHQRYCILKERRPGSRSISYLYAPVFNQDGKVLAIAGMPFSDRDYDFTRDAFFHAATIISLFLILLFVTVLIFTSITDSIFKPLVEISRKMNGTDADSLEKIEYDGDDEISSLVKAYNDMVVSLKASTTRLAVAERDKAWAEMARQVAHEIKNPLTPIKLEIQRLVRLKQKNDSSWETKFDKVSEIILEHIDILTQTANDFSTFAKLYTEDFVEFDLDKTIKDQIMLFDNGENVRITYLGAADATYFGPKPQLIRVFVNLLTNAIQAVEDRDEATIMVSLRRGMDGHSWNIVFEDNGPGVPSEYQDRLFTPNFTTKSSGTGLGLAICRSVVDKCGGTIEYSRSFALSGACFTVTLPVRQPV